jgi:hypothetical protein
MGGNHRYLLVALIVFGLIATAFSGSAEAEEVTLIGDVNESRQFETIDGEVINVLDNDVGRALRAQIGKHFEVTGTVEERQGGTLFMTVTSFAEIAACHGVNNAGRRLESAQAGAR